jgi:hypothetical protein
VRERQSRKNTDCRKVNEDVKIIDLTIFKQLRQFRQTIYENIGKAKDAVFELMDAVLSSPSIPSFVSLSPSPVFRRQWSSAYAALQDGRLDRAKLMAAFDRHYGNGKFLQQTAEIEADLLLRLPSNRCVYGMPPDGSWSRCAL